MQGGFMPPALNYFLMKITRRLSATFILIAFLATATLGGSPAPKQIFLVFVGTYTDKTESKGIYAYEFDTATGKLTPRGLAVETANPSWVAIHPNGKFLYAANESGKQSTISAFSIDAKSAKLTLLNQLPALGEDPCYLSFDKTGKYLFVANYTSGNVVVFPILPDGTLGPATANVKDTGTLGPNKDRQEAPHAHWIEQLGGSRVYVSDLGLDRVLFYDFDPGKGALTLSDATVSPQRPFAQNHLELAPGTGPRHVALPNFHTFYRSYFHQVYVLGELDSTVTVFGTSKEGMYGPMQKLSALPKGFSGRNDAAEITLHPSGKWLYASNRGQDSIAVFAVDPGPGTLKPIGIFSTGGKEPRHFAIDPTGQFLLAENQNSNSIVTFRINTATGALTQVSTLDGVPSPVCLVFLPNP
jgi:6-phosphogluconolactonase